MDIVPIPTKYRGINFRSRLEAKWAIVFDEFGWDWEYEPIDLNGYIPDFILKFAHAPMLVEVKPAMTVDELRRAVPKIISSGWDQESLIVGATLISNGYSLGIMDDRDFTTENWSTDPNNWEEAWAFDCNGHDGVGLCHSIMSYRCRVCGTHDGDHHIRQLPILDPAVAWDIATNATQYKHKRR